MGQMQMNHEIPTVLKIEQYCYCEKVHWHMVNS